MNSERMLPTEVMLLNPFLDCQSRVRIGWITAVGQQGEVFVDDPHREWESLRAKVLASVEICAEQFSQHASERGLSALIFQPDDQEGAPIVVGILSDVARRPAEFLPPSNKPEMVPDKVVIEAKKELTIRCGGGHIAIRQDGKIVVSGKEITSRAKQKNRVKGGSVEIN